MPPAGRDDDRRGPDDRPRDRDCVRYGDGDRCASPAGMAPPQIRMLALGNVRDRPTFQGSAVLGTAPRGTCASSGKA